MIVFRWSKRRFTIAFYVLSGWLPWGVHLDRGDPGRARELVHRIGRWPVCCGHVLRQREVDVWKALGLLVDGRPGPDGKFTLVAGPNLERTIPAVWHDMAVRSWGPLIGLPEAAFEPAGEA